MSTASQCNDCKYLVKHDMGYPYCTYYGTIYILRSEKCNAKVKKDTKLRET